MAVYQNQLFLYISIQICSSKQLKILNLKNIYNTMKNIKYSGVNLRKYMLDLYSESYKTLLREIEDLNKWGHVVYGSEDCIC